jgi:SAM-dependent methyltransferase
MGSAMAPARGAEAPLSGRRSGVDLLRLRLRPRSMESWRPSPSYLLRRWLVLRELRSAPPGRLLEIGPGAGDLMQRFAARGFEVTGCETSPAARAAVRRRFAGSAGARLVDDLGAVSGSFDWIVACEVMEHVDDDRRAIREWGALLSAGGSLLVTVPAHPERFGPSDLWAGHYRRYRRADLEALAGEAGLSVRRLVCFGFPLGNLIEPIRHRVHRRRLAREAPATSAQRTARSGVERGLEATLAPLLPAWLLLPFCWLQVPFLRTDLGTGYLMLASAR